MSLLPDLHAELVASTDKKWPAASVAFSVYAAVEDSVLESLASHAMTQPRLTHLSLHFDGIMQCVPDRGHEERVAFRQAAKAAILKDTGYTVVLALDRFSAP